MPALAKAGVEPFGLDGAEQLLDHPAPAVEPGDPPGLVVRFDPVAGQQPPVRRLDPRRRVEFARLDEEDGLGLRRAGLCGPVPRAPERDRAETHRDAGRARLLAGPGRQVHRMLLLRPALQAVEELAPAVGEDAVLRGPDQHVHALGPAGEHLVDVAFPVRHRSHARRPRFQQARALLHAVEPAPALLVAGRRRLRRLLAAGPLDHLRGDQAEKRPCLGLHRDRRVADHARAAAAVAEVRRVLYRQHMQARYPARRAPRRLLHHLRHRHLPVPQKPPDAHLPGAGPAHAAHGKAPGTAPDEPVVQKPPGLVNATVPKMRSLAVHRPPPSSSMKIPERYESQNTSLTGIPPFNTPRRRCVHTVGPRARGLAPQRQRYEEAPARGPTACTHFRAVALPCIS